MYRSSELRPFTSIVLNRCKDVAKYVWCSWLKIHWSKRMMNALNNTEKANDESNGMGMIRKSKDWMPTMNWISAELRKSPHNGHSGNDCRLYGIKIFLVECAVPGLSPCQICTNKRLNEIVTLFAYICVWSISRFRFVACLRLHFNWVNHEEWHRQLSNKNHCDMLPTKGIQDIYPGCVCACTFLYVGSESCVSFRV